MRRTFRAVCGLCVAWIAACSTSPSGPEAGGSSIPSAASSSVRYRLAIRDPESRVIEVELRLTDLRPPSVIIRVPQFNRSSLASRDLIGAIFDLAAEDATRADLPMTALAPGVWQVDRLGNRDVRIRYRVRASESPGTGNLVDAGQASLVPSLLFLIADGFERLPASLEIAATHKWSVHSTLSFAGGSTWIASDAPDLMDHPIEMGRFEEIRVDTEGEPLWVRLRHDAHGSRASEEYAHACSRLWSQARDILATGSRADYHVYATFGGRAGPSQTGAVFFPGACRLAMSGTLSDAATQLRSLETTARLMCRSLLSRHARRANPGGEGILLDRSPLILGFVDGLTDYLSMLTLSRAGVRTSLETVESIRRAAALDDRARGSGSDTLASLERSLGNREVAPRELELLRARGVAIAAALDLWIRSQTGGTHSVAEAGADLVSRLPASSHPGSSAIGDAVSRLTNVDAFAWMDRLFGSNEPINWASLMAPFGIEETTPGSETTTASLDALLDDASVASVREGGAAWQAGIRDGDVVTAIDGRPVGLKARNSVGEVLAALQPGQWVTVTVRRGPTTLLDRPVQLGMSPRSERQWRMRPHESLDAETRDRRTRWLGSGQPGS